MSISKRPSSPSDSVPVDATLRYRSASEGALCSSRCRELSRIGLTATVERPVFPGELLRIDLEPPMGGPSVLGLARVSWTGRDPEGGPGASIMRLRFLSFSEASRRALTVWLQSISSAADRASAAPRSPHDDSSVRALSRAIADSLLPPPPLVPGAPPCTESSAPAPAPAALPHRPTVPPPGMYTRSSKTLSHPVDRVAPAVHTAMDSARRSSRPPDAGTTLLGVPTEPEPIGPAAKSRVQGETSTSRRTAEIRERLNRLQRRRDNTPLMVPLQRGRASQPAPAYVEASDARASAETRAVAQLDVARPQPLGESLSAPPSPLPLGAMLNAPPGTTRRSSPPAHGAPASSASSFSSGSWPALRVPPSVAAVASELHDASPVPLVERRATIPPPASLEAMASLHGLSVSPPYEIPPYGPDATQAQRARLPIQGPSLPLSDAPWSVAAPRPRAALRPWVALCLGSLAAGAGLAYLAYGPDLSLRERPGGPAGAARPAASGERALDADELIASQIALPEMLSLDDLAAIEPDARRNAEAEAGAPAPVLAANRQPGVVSGSASPAASTAVRPAVEATAAPGSSDAPRAAAASTGPASAAVNVPPPPPALPAALGGPAAPARASEIAAPASRLERARACVARGDTECVIQLLKDASNEEELELWIETLRAQGRAAEARSAMQRFVEAFPNARRGPAYRRILTHTP